MTNENSSTFNDNSNFIEFQNLLNIMRDFLKSDTQQELPELQFQEVEEKTSGKITNSISEIWHKLVGLFRIGWEKMKEFIVNADNVVKRWLYSDSVLETVINNISQEIFISSTKFGTKIESIEMTEAYENDSLKEIEIDIKVSADTDINVLTRFWDYIGEKVDIIIDNLQFNDSTKAKEIKDRLLIVVSELN